jgi:F0F1-type ATP synthase membrane subunit b/b'
MIKSKVSLWIPIIYVMILLATLVLHIWVGGIFIKIFWTLLIFAIFLIIVISIVLYYIQKDYDTVIEKLKNKQNDSNSDDQNQSTG